jgi:hypothetical protein
MAKCSFPSSSNEMSNEVFLGEKLRKSRCGTSNTRPDAVSIRNGLFLEIRSSSRETFTKEEYSVRKEVSTQGHQSGPTEGATKEL